MQTLFIAPTASGAANQQVDIQPAAGEVWIVTGVIAHIEGAGANRTDVYMYDGTNELAIMSLGVNISIRLGLVENDNGANTGYKGHLIINNSKYLRIKFTADGAGDYYYWVQAVRIK